MGLLVWLLVIQIHGFDQNGGKGLPAKKSKIEAQLRIYAEKILMPSSRLREGCTLKRYKSAFGDLRYVYLP